MRLNAAGIAEGFVAFALIAVVVIVVLEWLGVEL